MERLKGTEETLRKAVEALENALDEIAAATREPGLTLRNLKIRIAKIVAKVRQGSEFSHTLPLTLCCVNYSIPVAAGI